MSEHLIRPPKSRWETFRNWCKSWSPQVKQGVIGGVVLIVLTVAGWVLYSTKGPSNTVRSGGINATNVSGSAFVQGIGNTVTVDNSIHHGVSNAIPALPLITIETLDGLPPECTNNQHLRLHRLTVRNPGDASIENFCSRLQLPEAISQTIETNTTVGAVIGWRPLIDKIIVKGTGGRTEGGLWIGPTSKVTFVEHEMAFFPKYAKGEKMSLSRAGDLTGVWELTIDRLPPSSHASISFLTSNGPEGTNYLELASVPLWSIAPNPQTTPDTNELRFSLEGEYQYPAEGKPGKQHFLVPIKLDADQRVLTSLPIQADNGQWHTVTLLFQ
jgi:hypothetical protein